MKKIKNSEEKKKEKNCVQDQYLATRDLTSTSLKKALRIRRLEQGTLAVFVLFFSVGIVLFFLKEFPLSKMEKSRVFSSDEASYDSDNFGSFDSFSASSPLLSEQYFKNNLKNESKNDLEIDAKNISDRNWTDHSLDGFDSDFELEKKEFRPVNYSFQLDLNEAQKADLMILPGIGEVLATRIVEYRTQNGSFESIDDLIQVKGIGEKKREAIRPFFLPIAPIAP